MSAITEDDGAGGRRLKASAAKTAVRSALSPARWRNVGTGPDHDDVTLEDIP
ncbi:hypothetical protein [Crateriforma spongiae]|uniref:hypothetical protein n=1 Tax=Crateriforma spongiae TaxID=2724528 RepID=UPI0039B05FAF